MATQLIHVRILKDQEKKLDYLKRRRGIAHDAEALRQCIECTYAAERDLEEKEKRSRKGA